MMSWHRLFHSLNPQLVIVKTYSRKLVSKLLYHCMHCCQLYGQPENRIREVTKLTFFSIPTCLQTLYKAYPTQFPECDFIMWINVIIAIFSSHFIAVASSIQWLVTTKYLSPFPAVHASLVSEIQPLAAFIIVSSCILVIWIRLTIRFILISFINSQNRSRISIHVALQLGMLISSLGPCDAIWIMLLKVVCSGVQCDCEHDSGELFNCSIHAWSIHIIHLVTTHQKLSGV